MTDEYNTIEMPKPETQYHITFEQNVRPFKRNCKAATPTQNTRTYLQFLSAR